MRLDSAKIPGRSGEIAALVYRPEHDAQATTLLFTHGFTSGKYSMDGLASYLAGRGYTGVTFDMVGHKLGSTGGRMERTIQAAENMQDALHWIRSNKIGDRVILIGHSMGAAAAIQTAAWERDSSPVDGLACTCMGLGPVRGFDGVIGKAMLKQRADYVEGSPALELLGGLNELVQSAAHLGACPALFIAANQDVLVPVASVEALAVLAGPHAQAIKLDSSHLEAPDRSKTAILDWISGLA